MQPPYKATGDHPHLGGSNFPICSVVPVRFDQAIPTSLTSASKSWTTALGRRGDGAAEGRPRQAKEGP